MSEKIKSASNVENSNPEKTVSAGVDRSTIPFSYHTFFFPFLWNGTDKVTRESFSKCLDTNHWIEDKLSDAHASDEKYNQYHYFNAAVRNAIYSENESDAIVWNYQYKLPYSENDWLKKSKDSSNKAKYVISKNKYNDDNIIIGEYVAELAINGIRLKLFNSGIGIIIFELENYKYKDEDTVNWINDFGRRIYMPFSSDGKCSGCADEISIMYDNEIVSSGDLTGTFDSFKTTRLAKPILDLLTNGEYSVTTDEFVANDTTFFIEPIIDDRMFVACYYVNENFANAMGNWDNGSYSYMRDAEACSPLAKQNTARRLYQMMFVDGSFMSCHSRSMIKELLEKHIYDRWVELGTITGITEYSMITVTSATEAHLANAFLTEYIEMVALTLAQRATLLSLERMISDSALGKKDIREIQKSYLLFQSQLLLKEVTPQQQGIELYQMLLDNMFISEQTAEIENHIEDLFTQKTANNEARENLILFVLAILGIFEATDFVCEWLCPEINAVLKLVIALAISLISLAIFLISRKK